MPTPDNLPVANAPPGAEFMVLDPSPGLTGYSTVAGSPPVVVRARSPDTGHTPWATAWPLARNDVTVINAVAHGEHPAAAAEPCLPSLDALDAATTEVPAAWLEDTAWDEYLG